MRLSARIRIVTAVVMVLTAPVSPRLSLATARTNFGQRTSPMSGFADSVQIVRDLLRRGRGIEAENVARALRGGGERGRGPDSLEAGEGLALGNLGNGALADSAGSRGVLIVAAVVAALGAVTAGGAAGVTVPGRVAPAETRATDSVRV